jgi:hypothetical protein
MSRCVTGLGKMYGGSESVVWGLSIPGGVFCVVWEHLWTQRRLVLWEVETCDAYVVLSSVVFVGVVVGVLVVYCETEWVEFEVCAMKRPVGAGG